MKKTNKTRIIAVVLSLAVIAALSATAFAEGPQGGPQMGGMQQDQQMGGPRGGMQQGGPQNSFQQNGQQGDFGQGMQMGNAPQMGGFGQDQQMGNAPQGGFGQDQQMGNAPQGGFGQDQQMGNAPQMGGFGQDQQMGAPRGGFGQNDGQQPPEKPEGDEDRTPPSDGENGFGPNGQMPRGGRDPMNQILDAVNELEDDEVKANIESLMQAHRDAMDAERNAEDDDARAEAAEATAAARDALNEALTAAGIEVGMEAPDGQPPEMPEGNEPPADGQEPPEKPEGEEDRTPPSNGQQPPEKPDGEAPSDGQQLSEDDQTIEENEMDRRLVENVVSLGSIFGSKTCVEGIETAGMRDILLKFRVQSFQGYYYAKPLPLAEFTKWKKK